MSGLPTYQELASVRCVIFIALMAEEEALTYDRIREAVLTLFPELRERIQKTFGSYYDLNEELPGAYPIFEDVVVESVFDLLEHRTDEALLARFFQFFEEMAKSPDANVSRDLLGIAVLESLVYKAESLRRAWSFMGPRMRALVKAEAERQGREESFLLDNS